MNTAAAAALESARNKATGQFGEQHEADPGQNIIGDTRRTIFDEQLAPGDDGVDLLHAGRMGEWSYYTVLPQERVRIAAAAAIYRDLEGPDTIVAKLNALGKTNAKAQLLIDRLDGLMVKECHIRWASLNGRVPLVYVLDKGVRGPGSEILLDQVIGVIPGYGVDTGFTETFARRRAQFVPRTCSPRPRTDLDEGDTDEIQAVYMMGALSSPNQPGTLYLATGRHGNIVEGALWQPGVGFPTHAPTVYVDDLVTSAGRLSEYAPGTLNIYDLMDSPKDRVEMYRAVMGVPFVADETARA